MSAPGGSTNNKAAARDRGESFKNDAVDQRKRGKVGKKKLKKEVSETRVEEAKAKMSDTGREAEADERASRNLRTNIIFKHTNDKQIL